MTKKNKIRLVNNHDYMTIRTANGNFTGSWSGYKVSGRLAQDKTGVFDRLIKFADDPNNGKTFGERMEKLTDVKVLSKLWPEWDKVYTNTISVNDRVRVTVKPKMTGTVISSTEKECIVKWDKKGDKSRIDFTLLEKF